MVQFNNLVRYGTVPGSGIYGTSTQKYPDGTTVRYIQRKAKKSLAGMHPIPKEFWENEHAESRLALLYVNCYSQAESRLLIFLKFFRPEVFGFLPSVKSEQKIGISRVARRASSER